MKLADAVEFSLSEARIACYVPILEDEEGPRWKFGYDNFHNDPSPDILLLGSYRHPSTGNNLVGGVNLHYIDDKQRDALSRALPEIMKQNNLKTRYRAGSRLLPDIFDNFYRTYNSSFIRGVKKDVLYPKYGYLKTAKKWLKKKMGGMFKSKAKREKELEPQYPTDLASMQDKLDAAVAQLAQNPPVEEPPDSPEMQAARSAFKDFQRQKTLKDIERQEKEPLIIAKHDLEQARQEPGTPEEQHAEIQRAELGQEPESQSPEEIRQELEADAEIRRQNLADPNNELDPNMDLEESIAYYSPVVGHYIFERVPELI